MPRVELGGGGPSTSGDAAAGQPPRQGKVWGERDTGWRKWGVFSAMGVQATCWLVASILVMNLPKEACDGHE